MPEPAASAEEPVAQLMVLDDYASQLDQVASVSTRAIQFWKRKVGSTREAELVSHPVEEWTRLDYQTGRSTASLVWGALALLVGTFMFVVLGLGWNELESGRLVMVPVVVAMPVYGVSRLRGSRCHRLVFTLSDGTTLRWISRPGRFDVDQAGVQRVFAFASERGIPSSSQRPATTRPRRSSASSPLVRGDRS